MGKLNFQKKKYFFGDFLYAVSQLVKVIKNRVWKILSMTWFSTFESTGSTLRLLFQKGT